MNGPERGSGMQRPNPQTLGQIAFLVVSVAWGTTYAAIHVAVETIPPFALAAMRFSLAGAVMIVVLRAAGIAWPARHDWPRLALIGFLLLSVANALMAWASQYLPSVMVALIINVGPVMTVGILAGFGQGVRRLAWGGLALGFAGMGMLILVSPELRGGGKMQAAHDWHFWASIAALVLGPLSWNVGAFYATRRPVRCHHLMSAGVQSLLGGVGAAALALLAGEWRALRMPDGRGWLAVAWLVVVGSWLGYVAYMYCVMHLSSPRVAVITYINNIVAVTLGWLVLGEKLNWAMGSGGAVLLAGVYVVKRATAPGSQNPKSEMGKPNSKSEIRNPKQISMTEEDASAPRS